jgi:two-component system, NtrC family, response regulator HydG
MMTMEKTPQKERILVVDDSLDTLELIKRNLESKKFIVFTSDSVDNAIIILKSVPIDLVITDYKMPGTGGLELIRYVRENYKHTEIMMITGYASIDGAVKAMKEGADEYLSKPFTDEELFSAINRSINKLKIRISKTKNDLNEKYSNFGLVGTSEAMQKVYRSIKKAAGNFATVVISGESGTGKEIVARAIHYNSLRASAPFVPINCGGIPEGLLESELFGYVKGAFTGAIESRAGFFQTAEKGSIFLDEISESTLSMQVKLLRVLQSKEICMVGSNKTCTIDIRIISASNKDLLGLVQKGLFREDLYFRLNVININLPPLRERGDDIYELINHFVQKFSAEMKLKAPEFSNSALKALRNYSWPGNVRELENAIQSIIVMHEDEVVDISDLPSHMRYSIKQQNGLNRTLAEVEKEYINNVLESTNNNKTKAAAILGIDRKTLRDKIKNDAVEKLQPSVK